MNEFITARKLAENWGVSQRRVQIMCAQGLIPGAIKFGNAWAIPTDTKKPSDGRITTGEYRHWRKKKGQ